MDFNRMLSLVVNELDFRAISIWLISVIIVIFFSILFNYVCVQAFILCFTLAFTYVGSLYIWRMEYGVTGTNLSRDHDPIIKRRFLSVSLTNIFSFFILIIYKNLTQNSISILDSIGFRLDGAILSASLPLLLTMILFAGPLVVHALDGLWFLYIDIQYWKSNVQSFIWLRNHVMAPLTEEFTFRACMVPMLIPCLGIRWAIITSPLFFGVAHFHHMMEKLRQKQSLKCAVLSSVFQFSYTTIFGIYSAFLFVRTGHFLAPFLVHSFCNHMGFPNFAELFVYRQPIRSFLMMTYVVGLGVWYWLLYPLTNPSIYSNTLWNETSW